MTRPEFRGMKVKAIRDVIDHKDIQLPSGATFNTKTVKRHSVAVYVFSLASKTELSAE